MSLEKNIILALFMKNMLVDKEHFLYKLKRISIVRSFLLVKQGECN